jgi:hypothetical protein
MAWQLLAAALPAAAKVAGTYLQKPSREDYQPQTDYMKKYLGYLRGRSAGKEVMHMAMQPQLRAIGRQGREMQRQVGYDVAKTGLTGSGIEAQMRLSAGAQTQEALSVATSKATAAQAAEDARIGEKSADLAARIESEEQRSKQAYEMAGRQWKRQMGAEVLGLGASIAGAGITQAGQLKEASMLATRSGYFGTAEDVQRMIDEGWTPQMFKQETARLSQVIGTYKGTNINELIEAQHRYTGSDAPVQDVDYADVPSGIAAEEKKAMVAAGMAEKEPVVEEAVKAEVTPVVEEAVKPVSEKEPLGKTLFGKYYDREAQKTADKVREAYRKGKKPVEEVVEPIEEAIVEPEAEVEETVVKPTEVKTEELKVEEPKVEEPEPEAAVKEVYKNKPYDIYDKKKTKSKTFRFTGNKTADGKYELKSDDGRSTLTLTLEELNDRLKKKGEKDVVGIRKKLVEGKHDIVNITEQTGLSSVLAGGEAQIRMAEPLANKFVEAKNILADKGIEIQVADSLVDYGVKKEQYEKWIAGGKKGAKVAHPDRSFHTIGYAFDLEQTDEMKKPEIAEVFKSLGLVPHPTEWWHWSLEKV